MRNILLEKSYTKCGGETILKFFCKKSKISISVDQNSKIFRSSLLEVFCKKGTLRNFAKFTGKHLCQSLFFNEVAGLRPATEHLRWPSCRLLAFTSYKAFSKNKKRSRTTFLASYFA